MEWDASESGTEDITTLDTCLSTVTCCPPLACVSRMYPSSSVTTDAISPANIMSASAREMRCAVADISHVVHRFVVQARQHTAACIPALVEQTCHLERTDWPRCRGSAGRDVGESRLPDALGFPGDIPTPLQVYRTARHTGLTDGGRQLVCRAAGVEVGNARGRAAWRVLTKAANELSTKQGFGSHRCNCKNEHRVFHFAYD